MTELTDFKPDIIAIVISTDILYNLAVRQLVRDEAEMSEITNRFPTDAAVRNRIAHRDRYEAEKAFAQLSQGMDPSHVIVATWTKPQFGNDRSYPVSGAGTLMFVLEGIRAGHCTNLRFFDEPPNRVPRGGSSYRDLFLS